MRVSPLDDPVTFFDIVNKIVYYSTIPLSCVSMKYSEFKRWLEKQGAKCKPGRGSHLHVELNGKHSVLPFHGAKEIPAKLVNLIKRDLGLK